MNFYLKLTWVGLSLCASATACLGQATTGVPEKYTYIAIVLDHYPPGPPHDLAHTVSIPYLGKSNESLAAAKANACKAVDHRPDDMHPECMTTRTSMGCSNGGYASLMRSYFRAGVTAPSTPFKVAGAACGKKTAALADEAARSSCEQALARRGSTDQDCLNVLIPGTHNPVR